MQCHAEAIRIGSDLKSRINLGQMNDMCRDMCSYSISAVFHVVYLQIIILSMKVRIDFLHRVSSFSCVCVCDNERASSQLFCEMKITIFKMTSKYERMEKGLLLSAAVARMVET